MATIYDVARLAGVAPSTVSRVFNGGSVAAEREALVRAAAEELKFVPDRIARRLNRKRSDLVALIIPDIQNPFFTSLARGVEDVAQDAGLSLVLCNADDDERKQDRYIEAAKAERMTGAIISPASGSKLDLSHLVGGGTAVVAIDRRPTGHPIDLVGIDDERGAETATAHLLEQGYRRIACLAGPRNALTARRRLRGYRRALRTAGIEPDRRLVQHTNYREDGGLAAMADLLRSNDPPDAVLATNSLLGVGAMEALLDADIRPPDIGLVSFSGASWSRLIRPPLTTVWQPAAELGQAAAKLLIRRQQEPTAAEQSIILETTLFPNQSSARPAP
ncbi:LacI family transcriptional regulator [Acrocarpospora pleiomorpha]|uniref:LacI family transcriptional regulator n=1 Tax=Acrocarpospora pleiomorpha TaxID=90975 RepID=A0A5M3XJZ1_9ACTN|nr:LacI family DNA-binding transcriptional regulator [Acrocarpospora pleiomorpha]GES21574.1 LacI family transcriptional regulator [Acrocarpospora pleiomorpha]